MQAVLDYARSQKTTGFLVIRDGRTLAEANWPLPPDAEAFRALLVHGQTAEGVLLEDVASQQKSLIAVLAAIAADKGLLDFAAPVAELIGRGWSRASADQEAAIRVDHLMTMTSGLGEDLAFAASPGDAFRYNTPAYAFLKPVLAAVAGAPLESLSHDWLTGPAGMVDTAWRRRPAAMADVGNPTGLVTTARDVARLGALMLAGGLAPDGRRVVSAAALANLLIPSPANPSYGRLWWLNGGAWAVRPPAERAEGPFVAAAPSDMIAALGAHGRKLYIVPDRRLIVVRLGQSPPDEDFDEQLWTRLMPAL